MYIDSHVHYGHRRFDNRRDELLEELHAHGLEATIEAAISIESNAQMQKLLGKYPWIYYAVGLHPNCVITAEEADEHWEGLIREALKHPKVVAIGETGLDYHRFRWDTEEDACTSRHLMERQKQWFHRLIKLAKEMKLPLVIHTRNAHEDTLKILQQYHWEGMPGVVHCFNGDYEIAAQYMDMGFVLGIGGRISHEEGKDTLAALQRIPLDKIILETDSPFLLPMGCTDSPNTSKNIPLIAAMVGERMGIRAEEVMCRTKERTREIFKLVWAC